MKVLVLFVCLQVACCVPLEKRANNCLNNCVDLFIPVCGSDGQTYTNQCNLDYAMCVDHTNSLTAAHNGACGGAGVGKRACEQTHCPTNFVPVCGVDGISYGNECLLTSCHIQKAHNGACDVLVLS